MTDKPALMNKLFACCLFVLSVSLAKGQMGVTNNGNLQVHAGGSLASYSNFTNAASGALVNNGSIHLKANVTNNQASMSAGTGTLHLNGTSAQAIGGSQAFRTYNLNTDNSAGITLNNNLEVSGAHTFSAGVITTSATPNFLAYQTGSSYSGSGDTRHVNGWIKKIGSTNFTFPVGNGTYERPVALNSLSAGSEFNVRHGQSTPNSYTMQSPPLWDVNESEYWTVNRVSGGSATVTLNWNNPKIYFPNWIVADIVAAGWNGTQWQSLGGTASGTAATTGSVTSTATSTFNLFALGSRSYILPLTLTRFTADRESNYTLVSWQTEREVNMQRFSVERSDDGRTFYQINQAAARNSGNTENYNTRDYATINRIAYYRLRSLDISNRESFSKIVAVTVDNRTEILLLTNPVRNHISLMATNNLSGEFRFTVASMSGQVLQTGKLSIQNGGNYTISLSGNITPGGYTLELSNGVDKFRYKLIVQ